MAPVDDAEILAQYGLESFTNTVFGPGNAAATEGVGRRHPEQQDEAELEGMQDLSISGRRRQRPGEDETSEHRRRHGGERKRHGEYGDDGDDGDDDDDDDDDRYSNKQLHDSISGGEVAVHSLAISDRDPLHVYQSVAAVLESRGDRQAMGDMAYRAQFSISNRNFSPAAFMQTVHNDTSYGDLVQGARLLRESVSQGTEALKILVHNNFDRFVDARNKIDLLYDEMKKRSLNDQAEFGTRAFNQSLQGTTRKADEIYNPIIERRARAEKIRSTLSVIERYKFYFNLPSSLIEYTRKGRFDVAVREYKKGRQLLQAVTDSSIDATNEAAPDDTQATALGRIFQYVWKEVQESVVELRSALFRRLGQPSRTYSEQENVIRYLLEIDPGEKDPVAFYLENQHTWIVDKMEEDYREYRLRALQASQQQQQVERNRTVGSGKGIIERYSQYVLRLAGILGESDTIVEMESLGSTGIATTLQRLPQTHALLAGHFMTALTELVVNTANDIEAIDMAQEPAIILANLISQLKAGLTLFLCEMWSRDARAMALHENWRLHHGTSYWPPFYVGRRDQHTAEDAPAVVAETIANTELLPLFLRTAQTITGQLGTIHAMSLQPGKSTRTMMQGQTPHFDANFDEVQRQQSERSHKMHDMALAHVSRTFFGTMYSFLDTLHALAFGAGGQASMSTVSPAALLQMENLAAPMFESSGSAQRRRLSFNLPGRGDVGSEAATRRRHSIDGSEQDGSRRRGERSFYVLATLCNLTAFRLFVVPDLLHSKAVRYTLKLDVADELRRLERLLRRLDEMIFSYYVRDKSQQLGAIVRRGVLMGGFSWTTTEMPRDTQPYVSEALLYLVFTHAEIMDLIAEVGAGAEHHMVKQQPLTKRVFQVLTANLAQDLLECVRAIDAFSVGGMLQCVLEALVISQTLQMYMTAPATECFRLLHAYVRSAFDRSQER
ncbi:Exocyst complex component S5, partial [Coemansia guatemalensis]